MSDDTTQLLQDAYRGDRRSLEKLLPLVYDELHRIATQKMRGERADHTLQPTALVNEAFLRLVDQTRVQWRGRAHFCAVAASMMRRILVDHARHRAALKRGARGERLPLDDGLLAGIPPRNTDLVALDELLGQLAELNPRHAQVVELRYFAGMSIDEIALVLDVSPSTVKNDWRTARAWLKSQWTLDGGEPPPGGSVA